MSATSNRGAAPLGRTRRATFVLLTVLTAVGFVVGCAAATTVGFADPPMAVTAAIVPALDILLLAMGLGWLVWLVRSDAQPTRPAHR